MPDGEYFVTNNYVKVSEEENSSPGNVWLQVTWLSVRRKLWGLLFHRSAHLAAVCMIFTGLATCYELHKSGATFPDHAIPLDVQRNQEAEGNPRSNPFRISPQLCMDKESKHALASWAHCCPFPARYQARVVTYPKIWKLNRCQVIGFIFNMACMTSLDGMEPYMAWIAYYETESLKSGPAIPIYLDIKR